MYIVKKIPDEPSTKAVDEAFDVLCGAKPLDQLSDQIRLPPNLKNVDFSQVDTTRWKDTVTWTDWWRRPTVLKKLNKMYSSITPDDWGDLPGTTNPVKSINRQSVHKM